MSKHIINYHKKWDTTGCVYDQTVNISLKEFKSIQKHISKLKNDDTFLESLACEKVCFVQILELEKGMAYTTHTVRNIISKFLKLDLKDRNTCFKVKGI